MTVRLQCDANSITSYNSGRCSAVALLLVLAFELRRPQTPWKKLERGEVEAEQAQRAWGFEPASLVQYRLAHFLGTFGRIPIRLSPACSGCRRPNRPDTLVPWRLQTPRKS